MLRAGQGYTIGDGRIVKFWTHRWLDGKALISHALRDIPEEQHSYPVRAYWNPGTGWDWGRLHRIASFDLASEEVGDYLIWVAHSGDFNLKSVLAIIRNEQGSMQNAMWKWIWQFRVPYQV